MHVLFVENAVGFGGSTVCVRRLAAQCVARRWRATVAVGYPDSGMDADNNEYDVVPLCQWCGQRRGLRASPSNAGAERERGRAGSILRSIRSTIRDDLPLAVRLARWLRAHDVQLVHANNELLVNRAAIIAGVLAGVPVVSHQRGPAWRSPATRLLGRCSDVVVAVSDFVADSLIEAGVPAGKVVRVYDGIDPAAFVAAADRRAAFRERYGFSGHDFVIGMPAVLLPWKGHEPFLRAFARVAAQRPGVRALIVGAAPAGAPDIRPRLEELCRPLGIADRVRFAGHVSDMPAAYAAMDLVVHASLDPEPFGLVVVEALAAGKPVVVADAGGPTEVITDGVDGLRYRPGDEAGLTRCLIRLCADQRLRRVLADRGRQRAKDFTAERTWSRIAELYRRVRAGKIGATTATSRGTNGDARVGFSQPGPARPSLLGTRDG